jgi:hypothetical protein
MTTPELWQLEWAAHPVCLVADHLKVVVAVPFFCFGFPKSILYERLDRKRA